MVYSDRETSLAQENLCIAIARFDGTKSWVQEYSCPRQPMTVLACLNFIREHQDQTLVFNEACRHAICGSCAVVVNGSACLACETQVEDLIELYETTRLFLSPLRGFPVLRDLAVDFDAKVEQMQTVEPWLHAYTDRTDSCQSREQLDRYEKATECILCGICASSCCEMAFDEGGYLAPFVMYKAVRFERDSRDEHGNGVRLKAVIAGDLWKCLHCQQCTTKCPKGIPVSEEIATLRRQALSRGFSEGMGPRHARVFYNDAYKWGRLSETELALVTEGPLGVLKNRVPFTMRMIARGKMNPLKVHPPCVHGIEGVRTLYRFAQTMDEDT